MSGVSLASQLAAVSQSLGPALAVEVVPVEDAALSIVPDAELVATVTMKGTPLVSATRVNVSVPSSEAVSSSNDGYSPSAAMVVFQAAIMLSRMVGIEVEPVVIVYATLPTVKVIVSSLAQVPASTKSVVCATAAAPPIHLLAAMMLAQAVAPQHTAGVVARVFYHTQVVRSAR